MEGARAGMRGIFKQAEDSWLSINLRGEFPSRTALVGVSAGSAGRVFGKAGFGDAALDVFGSFLKLVMSACFSFQQNQNKSNILLIGLLRGNLKIGARICFKNKK